MLTLARSVARHSLLPVGQASLNQAGASAAVSFKLYGRSGRRAYSHAHAETIELSSVVHAAPKAASLPPLIFLHGLFGNKKNATSVCKQLALSTGRSIHCLDLRNHGESAHVLPMTYDAMAADVSAYLRSNELPSAAICGHSMGGKVAMTMALNDPQLVERLVVADITPAVGSVQSEFDGYVEGMLQVVKEGAKTRKACDEVLRRHIDSQQIRLFLMTNWQREESTGEYSWRVPIELLRDAFDNIGDFPATGTYKGPTLFIKGEKSRYINRHTEQVAKELFPRMSLSTVQGASHWVHADKPKEFVDLVTRFCAAG